jgi:hypothetical protein
MISLFWTLVSALIFQPALMGPARAAEPQQPRKPAGKALHSSSSRP